MISFVVRLQLLRSRACKEIKPVLTTACTVGEAELFQTNFTAANQQKSRSSVADIKKVQKNSYLVKLDLHCAYSAYRTQKLADSHQKPEALTQPQRAPGSRISKCAREDSCKIGCQYKVSILQYALWPWATCITLQSMDHVNADGQQVHGPEAECSQSRRNVAPHLSEFVKQLVLSLATLGLTATQILADLQGKKQAEQLTGRDAEIKDQDIHNIIQQLDQQTWRYHPDVAAFLRAWVLEHQSWVWMYQEHMSSAPVFDSAQDPASDAAQQSSAPPENSFQLGFSTPTMTQNAIQHANDDVVLCDATFGTNANKLSLYTGLAIDDFGNGLPIFHALTYCTSQPRMLQLFKAWQAYMHKACHGFSPSWFMVDAAQAEINAIK